MTLLIGGCWTALEEIHRNLSSHPRIPVLAFPYLGGLSKILAIAIELDAKLKHMRKSRKRWVLGCKFYMILPVARKSPNSTPLLDFSAL